MFLTDGDVSLKNNASERAIRRVFIGKKNWQVIDAISEAKSSASIYSIAETAKANNLKPYDYFAYLLKVIPKHMDDKKSKSNYNHEPRKRILIVKVLVLVRLHLMKELFPMYF